MVACLGEQPIGSASAIAIDDDAADFLGDGDEGQALDAAQGPGRRAEPFHRRQGILDALGEAQLVGGAREANRPGAEQAKRDLGLRDRFVQHVLGIKEGALHRDHAQKQPEGCDFGGLLCQGRYCADPPDADAHRASCRKDPAQAEQGLAGQILHLLTNRDVPATNNISEREIRPSVVFRKVTNGFRSVTGTARLQGKSALQAMRELVDGKFAVA